MTAPAGGPFRAPLVGADTWVRVLGEAGWRCECTGECGRPHVKSGHRCGTEHGLAHRLSVVPVDPSTPLAAAVSGAPLVARCTSCAAGAKTATTSQLSGAVIGQLDLFGGDAA